MALPPPTRKGFTKPNSAIEPATRDAQRMVNRNHNVFAASMVTHGDADAMVTGLTRNYHGAIGAITKVIDEAPGERAMGMTMLVSRDRTVFLADTAITVSPTGEELAKIATQTANQARRLGFEPRVAMCSFSNFGNPLPEHAQVVKNAVTILDRNIPDFEYDGEMSPAVALNEALMRSAYPFCRLSGPANVLVMPGLNSANISTTLMERLGGSAVIGPLLVGLAKPAQIVRMGVNVSDMANVAALAAHDAIRRE